MFWNKYTSSVYLPAQTHTVFAFTWFFFTHLNWPLTNPFQAYQQFSLFTFHCLHYNSLEDIFLCSSLKSLNCQKRTSRLQFSEGCGTFQSPFYQRDRKFCLLIHFLLLLVFITESEVTHVTAGIVAQPSRTFFSSVLCLCLSLRSASKAPNLAACRLPFFSLSLLQ